MAYGYMEMSPPMSFSAYDKSYMRPPHHLPKLRVMRWRYSAEPTVGASLWYVPVRHSSSSLLPSLKPCRAMASLPLWSVSGSQTKKQTDLLAVSGIEPRTGKQAIPLCCKFVRNYSSSVQKAVGLEFYVWHLASLAAF